MFICTLQLAPKDFNAAIAAAGANATHSKHTNTIENQTITALDAFAWANRVLGSGGFRPVQFVSDGNQYFIFDRITRQQVGVILEYAHV